MSLVHTEPFCVGMNNLPSTAFCLLYKLCTMGVNKKQLKSLLGHKESPFIRAIGFLYLRYVFMVLAVAVRAVFMVVWQY
jgi:pre-mRNA-splicing factor 38B